MQDHKLLNHWGINWKVATIVSIAIHSSYMHMSTAHVKLKRVCTNPIEFNCPHLKNARVVQSLNFQRLSNAKRSR